MSRAGQRRRRPSSSSRGQDSEDRQDSMQKQRTKNRRSARCRSFATRLQPQLLKAQRLLLPVSSSARSARDPEPERRSPRLDASSLIKPVSVEAPAPLGHPENPENLKPRGDPKIQRRQISFAIGLQPQQLKELKERRTQFRENRQDAPFKRSLVNPVQQSVSESDR